MLWLVLIFMWQSYPSRCFLCVLILILRPASLAGPYLHTLYYFDCYCLFHFILLFLLLFFFFFKQKTAYEILTCDWSSDVCSSDLSQYRRSIFSMPAPERAMNLRFGACLRNSASIGNRERITIPSADFKSCLQSSRLSRRSEERRVGKECRSRWSPYH